MFLEWHTGFIEIKGESYVTTKLDLHASGPYFGP